MFLKYYLEQIIERKGHGSRKRKLNFDEHFHLVKRERIEAEDETKKIVEGSNKGGIASVNENNGEIMALDNACVLN